MSDPQPPAVPPEQLNLRRELRRQLHTVDGLTPPPAPDFAGRAIAAARDAEAELAESVEVASDGPPARLVTVPDADAGSTFTTAEAVTATGATSSDPTNDPHRAPTVVPPHRRRWARVLVGAAAAVAIGAVAVPTLPRLLGGTSSSTTGSAAVAPAGSAATAAGGSAPDAETSGPRVMGKEVSPSGPSAASTPLASGIAIGPAGSSSDLTPVVEQLRARLTTPPYDVTSVVLRANPTRVEITVRAPDAAVLDLARGVLPEGTPVVILRAR